MKIKCYECKKEFNISDPEFIALFKRKEEIYCWDCIWNHHIDHCIGCIYTYIDALYGRQCKIHKDGIPIYCIEKEKLKEREGM